MSRELIDLEARKAIPAAERIRALVAACEPEIDALGLRSWLEPLEGLIADGDHATRWKDRVEAGEDMEAIHAEQVEITMASARRLAEKVG